MDQSLTASLAVLTGQRLAGIGRAATMGIFEFGSDVAPQPGGSSATPRAEFALHVQCAFRITRNGRVVLGSNDQSWIYGVNQGSMYDVRAGAIDSSLANVPYLIVDEVCVMRIGDISIRLSDGVEIQVFVDSSRPTENWRFIHRPGRHTVFPADD